MYTGFSIRIINENGTLSVAWKSVLVWTQVQYTLSHCFYFAALQCVKKLQTVLQDMTSIEVYCCN